MKKNEDEKLSISLMSTIIALTIQLLLIMIFTTIGMDVDNIIKLCTKMIVIVSFCYSIKVVFNRSLVCLIITYILGICVVLATYLFKYEYEQYLSDMLVTFFFLCLPCFLVSLSIRNVQALYYSISIASRIILCIGSVLIVLIGTNLLTFEEYNMSLGYYMLMPALYCLGKFLEEFKITYFFALCISILVIVLFGSRGPLVCILVFFIVSCINLIGSKSKYAIYQICVINLILLVLILMVFYFREIMTFSISCLNNLGINSRTINLLLNGQIGQDSGRSDIQRVVMKQIIMHPFLGIGIGGDRFFAGTYSHNIIIEIISDFGIPIGISLLIVIFYFVIKSIFFGNLEKRRALTILFCLGMVPLFISGSYITDHMFWIFIGCSISLNYWGKRIPRRNIHENKKNL